MALENIEYSLNNKNDIFINYFVNFSEWFNCEHNKCNSGKLILADAIVNLLAKEFRLFTNRKNNQEETLPNLLHYLTINYLHNSVEICSSYSGNTCLQILAESTLFHCIVVEIKEYGDIFELNIKPKTIDSLCFLFNQKIDINLIDESCKNKDEKYLCIHMDINSLNDISNLLCKVATVKNLNLCNYTLKDQNQLVANKQSLLIDDNKIDHNNGSKILSSLERYDSNSLDSGLTMDMTVSDNFDEISYSSPSNSYDEVIIDISEVVDTKPIVFISTGIVKTENLSTESDLCNYDINNNESKLFKEIIDISCNFTIHDAKTNEIISFKDNSENKKDIKYKFKNMNKKSSKRKLISEDKENIPIKGKKKIKNLQLESYECKFCFKDLKSSSNLRTHLRIHTGERPFICEICKIGFKQRQHMNDHFKIHTGERPNVCKICWTSFIQRTALATHMKSAHHKSKKIMNKKIKAEPELYCKLCRKKLDLN